MSSEPENFVAHDARRKPPPPPPRKDKLPGVSNRRGESKSDGEENPDFSALLDELKCTQSLSSLVNAPNDIEISPEGSNEASTAHSMGGNFFAALGASGKIAGPSGQASLYNAPTPAAFAGASGVLPVESSQMIRPLLDLPPSEALAMLPSLEPPEGIRFDRYLSTLAPGFTGVTASRDDASVGNKQDRKGSESASVGGVHLKGVPEVYFDENYSLGESPVFARKSLRSLVQDQDEANTQLAQQLDTVEVRLASKLSNFDQLLGSLKDLGSIQADIVQGRSTVSNCRTAVKELQSGCLDSDFQLARNIRRRARLNKVCRLLMCMRTVEEVYINLGGVIESGEFLDALDLIDKVRKLLQDELGGVAAVRSIRKSLDDSIKVIDRTIESEFISVCSSGVVVVLDSSKTSVKDARKDLSKRLQREKVFEAMNRRHLLSSTIQTDLRDALLARARRLVKKVAQLCSARLIQDGRREANGVTSSEDARGGDGTTTDAAGNLKYPTSRKSTTGRLERALAKLSSDQLLTLWGELMGAAVNVAQGLQWFDEEMKPYYGKKDEKNGLRYQVERVANSVMQAVLVRCGQVLQLRQNKNSLMSPEDLSKLIAITSHTLSEKISPCFEVWQSGDAEKSAGEMTGVPGGANLSAIVLQQAKLAVEEIHQANVAQANLLLEREKWERCDVPQNFEIRVISKLMPSNSEIQSDTGSDESQSKELTNKGRRYLVLPEDRGSFLVVPAGLGILELVAVYLDVARALPQLVTDVAVRLTSMLRLANGQIEKLLLEGQAVSSGSRKTVTATNLALTYQTIDMLSNVLPLVAETLESISGPDGGPGIRIVLEDILYRLTAEMSEHKANLMRKLGDILVERFDHHCAKWLSAERASRCKERKGPNENVVKIINDVSSMHRVLMKSLSPKCVGLIFSRVFVDFSSRFEVRLVKEKKKVDDVSILGPWRTSILADLSQIVIKLSPIGDVKNNMEASVKEMLEVVDRVLPPDEGGATSADLLKLLQHTSEQGIDTDSSKSESKSHDEPPNVTE